MLALPFSSDQFFGVFEAYNAAFWPAQAVLLIAALLIAIAGLRRRYGRVIAAFLAALWLWSGLAYHLAHFATINPAARLFAGLFVGQAVVFGWWGLPRGRIQFGERGGLRFWTGVALLSYALVVYPLIGIATGHAFMNGPTFGAPCPVVIYTFGILLLLRGVPVVVLIAPVLWAVIGSSAVLLLGVAQDAGLAVSALLAIGFTVRERFAAAGRPRDPSRRRRGREEGGLEGRRDRGRSRRRGRVGAP